MQLDEHKSLLSKTLENLIDPQTFEQKCFIEAFWRIIIINNLVFMFANSKKIWVFWLF